jgi:hypothetical protein
MRHLTAGIVAAVLVMTAQIAMAQTRTPMKPTVPGTPGDPVWQAVVPMHDGRTFVTDGGLAIDAAFAKPASLPERQVPAKAVEDLLGATHKDECGFNDLVAAGSGKTYTTPSGIALNATYVKFLRRILSSATVRFRMSGNMQPVVIVAGGKAVGVLMPVKQ